MSTGQFDVPVEPKQAFNAAFEGQNKSAVIAELMREAMARVQRRKMHRAAADRILAERVGAPKVSAAQFRAARDANRRHFDKARNQGQIA